MSRFHGYIGFGRYCQYILPNNPWVQQHADLLKILIAMAVGGLNVVLLYRRITSIGKITVSLWIGTMLAILADVALEKPVVSPAPYLSSYSLFNRAIRAGERLVIF